MKPSGPYEDIIEATEAAVQLLLLVSSPALLLKSFVIKIFVG